MIKKLSPETDRTKHKVKASAIKPNDLMAFVYYGKIKDAKPDVLQVQSLGSSADLDFQVRGRELIESGFSADQFEEEVKVTKTKAAETLIASHNRPLTVCFEKTDGSERVMRGRLITPEPLLGRSMVEDLDITEGHRLRLVDHRTIKYLIVEGVKYVVK
jgi:hypothetical protein